MMQQLRFGPSFRGAVKTLVIINTVIFLIDILLRTFLKSDFIIYNFSLIPELVVKNFYIWQIFTYQFLHGGIFHILFNMMALWMFGAELEARWGSKKFYQFYLISGTFTGVIILTFNLFMGNNVPTIGASGVIFAIMLAYAIYWGDRVVYLWMLIPIKIKYFVIIMGLISFVSMINPGASNISHIGHLGGILSGYLCLKFFMDKSPSANRSMNLTYDEFSGRSVKRSGILQKIKMFQKKREWAKKEADNFSNMSDEKKVDEILQKISRKGIRSLSRAERDFLKKTSDKMNGKDIH